MTAPEPTPTAAEHIDAVALDLDAIEARANAATEWNGPIGGPATDVARKDVPALVAYARRKSALAADSHARAESAEAEVRSLRAKVAAVEAEKEAILGQVDQAARLLRLNGKQADAQTVIAQVRRWPEFVDRAALATGEGE